MPILNYTFNTETKGMIVRLIRELSRIVDDIDVCDPDAVSEKKAEHAAGMIRGMRLFSKQGKEKLQEPNPKPWEEFRYIIDNLPELLGAYEATLKRETEKDAEIARLKIKLSRPESDYLLEKIIHLTAERDAEKRRADAAISDMFGCMSTQGQCVRCKKRYYCDGTDDDKFSPLCKNNSHCYAWEWRGLHADNTDAPTGAESEQNNESESRKLPQASTSVRILPASGQERA